MRLPRSFYTDQDAVGAARSLLGKVLVTRLDGQYTAGVINETEAYLGEGDRASHAFGGRRTTRNEPMYGNGGMAYVYLCYGIHHLFNVVVMEPGVPQAVLIRSVVPLEGLQRMAERRGVVKLTTHGPGTLTEALGIRTAHSGIDLTGQCIWIEDRGFVVPARSLIIGPRVGVDYAGADALLPYRFRCAPSQLALT